MSHIRRSLAAGLALSGLLTACYAPSVPAGAPCGDADPCPVDQQCFTGHCRYNADLATDAGMGDAPPVVGCQSNDTCATATVLGAVSGDTGQQTLSAQGSRAAWFRVRVSEDDDFGAHPLRVLATLAPPSGVDFDVLLHVNVVTDLPECIAQVGVATSSSAGKQVRASWGEDTIPNGLDDDRDLAIEVRPRSGTCAPGALWTLTIAGNAN